MPVELEMSDVELAPTHEDSEIRTQHSWRFAAYHTTTSVLGAGVLALPLSISYLGWGGGMCFLCLSTLTSFYTAWLLIELAESHSTYSAIADAVMWPGFANRVVRPFQGIVFGTVAIVACVLGGQTLQTLDNLHGGQDVSLSWWIVVFGSCVFLATLWPDLGSVWWISAAGALSGVMISAFPIGGSIKSIHEDPAPSFSRPAGSEADFAFGVMNAFGLQAFAYGGHSVIPDIQATLSGTPEQAELSMKKALKASYAVIVPAYFLVAGTGYGAFGNIVQDNIIDSVQPVVSEGINYAVNAFLVMNTLAIGTLYNQAAFVLVEDILFGKASAELHASWSGRLCKLMIRVVWMSVATVAGTALPFFGDIAGLSGAVGFTPMTFVFPALLWNSSKLAEGASCVKIATNWGIVVGFTVIGVVAAVGAVYDIQADASSYKSFM